MFIADFSFHCSTPSHGYPQLKIKLSLACKPLPSWPCLNLSAVRPGLPGTAELAGSEESPPFHR